MNMANSIESTVSDYDQLIKSTKNINKYSIDKRFKITYKNLPHKPSLVVIYSNGLLSAKEHKLFRSNCHILDTNSKVLVLVNTSEPNLLNPINEVLTKERVNYVVYVNTDDRFPEVIYMDPTGSIAAQLDYYPHPDQLFRDAIRDMQGRPMIYSFFKKEQLQYHNWMQSTGWYLNATVVKIVGPCKKSTPGLDCLAGLIRSCEMDIPLNQFVFLEILPVFYRVLFNIQPDAEVILAPRGRPLNIFEMFIKPFSWEVWSTLVLILVAVEIISWIFPSLFKNDPILLLVCGFERQDLHHANTRERMIFLPLVMFFFLITSVYETKITSYMMQMPSMPDIHTMQELIQSGLKVKVKLSNNRKILSDELLGSVVVNSSDSLLHLDGVHAYLADVSEAENVVRMLDNYDFELERPMYNILTERRRMDLYLYWIPYCTPLLETLYFTQKTFYEAGLWNRWMSLDWKSFDAQLTKNRDRAVNSHYQFLSFKDLVPAWIAISSGFLTSGVLFLLECAVGRFRSVKNGKWRCRWNK
ncbi:hypothetical protein RP20_CCG004735 [Aedes albopictus]|nr:hypothetical protein RP20_CCG004735 [Aedes albopictus]